MQKGDYSSLYFFYTTFFMFYIRDALNRKKLVKNSEMTMFIDSREGTFLFFMITCFALTTNNGSVIQEIVISSLRKHKLLSTLLKYNSFLIGTWQ